jgi:hypothetical protein
MLWINFNLLPFRVNLQQKRQEIIKQQYFLKNELKNNNLTERMQALYPEGAVFINVLYGLTWCELANNSQDISLRNEAIREAIYAFEQICAPEIYWSFQENIKPAYGIFYVGWKNYLLSKILLIDNNFKGRDKLLQHYKNACVEISSAKLSSYFPFLPSYENSVWPADNLVAMASIANYHLIVDAKYDSFLASWVKQIKSNLDTRTRMIPHAVHYDSGEVLEGARGSSSSLMIRMMAEIDPDFAADQYRKFQAFFVNKTLDLPSVSEYPKGQTGKGDVDSGPVVFGVGFAATIVSIGTHAALNNDGYSEAQYQTIDAFGFPFTTSASKQYLFGKLPIADAFIAWSRAASSCHPPTITSVKIQFHLYSLLILVLAWIVIFYTGKSSIRLQH